MAPIIAAALPIVGDIVKRFVKDPDEAQRIEAEMYRAAAAGNLREMERAADVIVAEAKSGGLAAAWRPILMLLFGAIVANNYIVAPYMSAMFGWSVSLAIPPDMWDLLKIGVGGYIVGRSAEKGVKAWKEK